MKTLILLLLLPFFGLSQYHVDSIGKNDNQVLNPHEIEYLKELIQTEDSLISLENKRIHFATNNWGAIALSKSEFFNNYCKPRSTDSLSIQLSIIELTPEEKQALKIDVMIVAWSKIAPVGRARKKFIQNIQPT
ncbi:hypothetical protein [Lishizhenia sp.]|uniref:hypothetical protein n=1 Tax=Lishizhenia sp. TaxID=2497594 RepID=UPI00299D23E5|nr:hypothetical protein [Lishizhenia sp.]MDX1446595.1 hypothetical protein [Lishizhenia sp.]